MPRDREQSEKNPPDAVRPVPARAVALRYVAAIVAVAVSLAATLYWRRYLAPQFALLFYAAAFVSAWYGGLGPGLLATALSALAIDYFFIGPPGAFGEFNASDAVGLSVFAGVAIVTSSLSSRLRIQRAVAEARAREVERLAAQLEARAALRLEEKVREAESLAADLARANRSLGRKTAEAESASRAKSEFLAAVSHEIKTPLNAIAGYAQLMALGTRGPVTDAQRHDLERIELSQRHLLSLVDDLLDLAKAESGRLSLALCDVSVSEVVMRACALVEPQLVAKGLRLECAPSDDVPAVRADRDRLTQVLANLLSNAVKFTAKGTVGIAAEVSPRRVGLRVSDTGRGIPPDDQARILEPFTQVLPSDGARGFGTGLGLSISRDLTRAMGGELTVESTPDVGSVFTVWLARADVESALVRGARAMPPGAFASAGGVITLWPPIAFVPPSA